jgi:ribosome biogenesis SPOUT family RNA methylase Rps3
MTQRSAVRHRLLELKASVMARVANRLFTSKQMGLDGHIKRLMLKQPSKRERVDPTKPA